jgi:hypothetical protein
MTPKRTTPLTHRFGISHLPLVQSVFRLWPLVTLMIYQELTVTQVRAELRAVLFKKCDELS